MYTYIEFNLSNTYLSNETIKMHKDIYRNHLDNLNNLLLKNNYDYKYTKEELVNYIDIFPIKDRDDILYHLGGVLNHELYFSNMININDKLKEKIKSQYGTLDNFKKEFIKQANYLVGSGYTFLVLNKENNLEIISLSNEETPYIYGLTPVLNIDLWEHSYYLDYKNDREKYINDYFKYIDLR